MSDIVQVYFQLFSPSFVLKLHLTVLEVEEKRVIICNYTILFVIVMYKIFHFLYLKGKVMKCRVSSLEHVFPMQIFIHLKIKNF